MTVIHRHHEAADASAETVDSPVPSDDAFHNGPNHNDDNDDGSVDVERPTSSQQQQQRQQHPQLQRKSSVSEAAEEAAGGWHAPRAVQWFQWPFETPDPTTGRKLPEVTGQAMDAAARGPLNQVGAYVGSAILQLAKQEAKQTTDGTVYGLKPSSLLTAKTSIVGVAAALLMPFFGAIVDHTRHRKLVGVVSGYCAVAVAGIQIAINANNWFFMLVVDALGGFSLLVHLTATFAYLPDLTLDEQVLGHYTSRINIRQFVSQFIFTGLVILVGQVRDIENRLENTVQNAKDSTGIAFGASLLFISYAWMFLFRKRPALSKVPEGSNLLTTGFCQVAKTSKKVTRDYRALRWFMMSLLFSPEAGAGVVQSIAVTFFNATLGFSGLDIAKVSLVLIVANVPGSFWSKYMCNLVNPLNSYRLGQTMLGAGIGVAALVLKGPQNYNAVFGFAAWWGFALGWAYPSQRVLFVQLIPKGQETEFMGLFVFMGQILGWLPPLIFTIMNEYNVDQRWGLAMVGFFCFWAVTCTLPMGAYRAAVELVYRDSEAKLEQVVWATQHDEKSAAMPTKDRAEQDKEDQQRVTFRTDGGSSAGNQDSTDEIEAPASVEEN